MSHQLILLVKLLVTILVHTDMVLNALMDLHVPINIITPLKLLEADRTGDLLDFPSILPVSLLVFQKRQFIGEFLIALVALII